MTAGSQTQKEVREMTMEERVAKAAEEAELGYVERP